MLYVTGDIHGDFNRFYSDEMKRLKKNDTLLICGDFGFLWEDNEKEQKLLKKLAKRKYTIAFVDGTHENFKLLNQYEVTEWNGGKVHQMGKNLYHLMRGQVYELEGKKVFCMGGGESSDLDIRSQALTWDIDEIPTEEELQEALQNLNANQNQVDLVITHEPPEKIRNFLTLQQDTNTKVSTLSTFLEKISLTLSFQQWFFGSMHIDKHITKNFTAVYDKLHSINFD